MLTSMIIAYYAFNMLHALAGLHACRDGQMDACVGNSARRVTRGNRWANAGGSQPLVILI